VPQIDGSKTGLELPGIVDQVMTLAEIKPDVAPGQPALPSFRGLVCQTLNPWGYPAKDRSGRLAMLEPPHLGQIFQKIRSPSPPAAGPGVTPLAPTTPTANT
jgi:hypothetical protein